MRRATHESDERVACKIARAMARIGSKFDARTNDGAMAGLWTRRGVDGRRLWVDERRRNPNGALRERRNASHEGAGAVWGAA
jgi:hypothetical protein